MPDYKRIVSYIYNYEEGIKRNNVGYARVETRNSQCKCTFHITAPSLNDKQLKAYIYRSNGAGIEGILLGNFPIKNGIGEYKTITGAEHIMNSPYGIEDMSGIILYLSNQKFFATEWDDVPITMKMVAELENNANLADNLKVQIHKDRLEVEQEDQQNSEIEAASIIEQKIEEESEQDRNNTEEQVYSELKKFLNEREAKTEEHLQEMANQKEKDSANNEIEEEEKSLEECEVKEESIAELTEESAEESTEESMEESTEEIVQGTIELNEVSTESSADTIESNSETIEKNEVSDEAESVAEGEVSQDVQSMEKGECLQEEGANPENGEQQKSMNDDHPLAKQISKKFQRMYPFEDNDIAWCVRIEPQNIGLLPMEVWLLGNNSFLLHGYYSYRHLIFARINDKDGFNYILGVPGIYHNREKFMANMFGFENFKPVKRKELRTGEFGYWYVPIILS